MKDVCAREGFKISDASGQSVLFRQGTFYGIQPERFGKLLYLKAIAVHALLLSGIGLVRADLNGVQAAVIFILAMVGAIVDCAFHAGVGRAGDIAVGTIFIHERVPPVRRNLAFAMDYCAHRFLKYAASVQIARDNLESSRVFYIDLT